MRPVSSSIAWELSGFSTVVDSRAHPASAMRLSGAPSAICAEGASLRAHSLACRLPRVASRWQSRQEGAARLTADEPPSCAPSYVRQLLKSGATPELLQRQHGIDDFGGRQQPEELE